MKRISKLILMMVVMFFVLSPTQNSLAKDARFYYSEKTKKNYDQEESVLIAKDSDFHNFYASEVYSKVKKVEFEEGITKLDPYVFYYFPNVEKIILPSTIKELSVAFQPFENHTKDSVEKKYALRKLKTIEVNPENPYYTSIEDGLYTKDESELICYPADKESSIYVMPDLVQYIGADAFGYNTKLTEIVFGARMNAIYGWNLPYYGCLPNLTSYKVDENSCYMSAINGLLYDYDQTRLLSVPCGREIEKLILPDTVTELGYGCLAEAKIDEFVLPEKLNINSPETAVFQDNRIETFTAKEGNKFSVVDGALYDKEEKVLICWPERKSVEDLKFPSTLETIPNGIPHTENIKHLIIPKACMYINLNLRNGNSIETIDVEEGNKSYMAQDTILYSKDGKRMYLMAGKSRQTTVTVPKKYLFSMQEGDTSMPSVTKIIVNGDGIAFPYYLFPNVKEITAGAGNKKLKVKDQVLYTADMKTLLCYPAGKTNKSFTIPSSVTGMSDYAFYGQTHLETLTLSKNLKSGENDNFEKWFMRCTALKSIKVEAGNKSLCAVDGVLYNKKKTSLIYYPSAKTAKSLQVPDSVETFYIGNGNSHLTSLQLGSKFIGFLYRYDQEDYDLASFTKLNKISVSKKNKENVVQDNVLYQKTGKYLLLVAYPMGKKDSTYTFGKNVTFGYCDWKKYTRLKTIKSLNPYVSIFDKDVSDYSYGY